MRLPFTPCRNREGDAVGNGFMGKVLWVDLSSGSSRVEEIPDSVYREYLSGSGLAARLLYDRIPPAADPMGPDNVLGFVSGLLTGSGSLFTGRWMAVCKSPLTRGWGEANCGGYFSPAIKRAGFDGIFVTGAAPEPVYLLVHDGKAEIRSARDLWGKDTLETENTLKATCGLKDPQVAVIGPAGEKLSLMAGITNDRGRIAARSGVGAVMGSKKLKAVVCAGSARVAVADRERVKALSKVCVTWVKDKKIPLPPGDLSGFLGVLMRVLPTQLGQDGLLYKSMLARWGTCSMNQISPEIGDAPLQNWKGTNAEWTLKRSRSVNPDAIISRETSKYRCFSCPLACGGICRGVGPYEETHKPEYETTLALGGLLLNEDKESIFLLNEMLNRAGMDTISAGSTVAFAMECFEKGILTTADTGGIDLAWGNAQGIIALVEKMIAREGLGDLLADGSKKAAERIGKGSAELAMHAGGQDLPMHDGRYDPGFALHYSVEPTPGRHTLGAQLYYEMFQLWKKVPGLPGISMMYGKGRKYEAKPEHARMAVACSQYSHMFNGAGLCKFGAFVGATRTPVFDWVDAVTGWGVTPEQLMQIGERSLTTKQAFNVRHGVRPRDNFAPPRSLGSPPLPRGANKGRTVDLAALSRMYWDLLGWDPATGIPTPAALERLGIPAI